MLFSSTAVCSLSLLALSERCSAFVQRTSSLNSTDGGPGLVKRVPTASSLFTFVSSPTTGACTAENIATIDTWLEEATLLHNAAVAAFGLTSDIPAVDAVHLLLFLGIQWAGSTVANPDVMSKLGVRLAAVTQFLEGSFSFDGGQLPYLYCDDTFASPAEWDQPARDAAGNTIDNKDGGLVTLSQLYPTTVKTEAQAFYNTLLGGYKVISLLDPNGVLYSGAPFASICGKPGLQGLTSSAQSLNPSPVLINTDGDTFTASPMRRHMLICSSQFSGGKMPPATSSHAVGSLASIVESANYPTADSARGLDSYTTQGATLYHELFHLTDTEALPTGDPYSSLGAILTGSKKGAQDMVNNPESYVMFAFASYLWRNAPTGSTRIMFMGGGPSLPNPTW